MCVGRKTALGKTRGGGRDEGAGSSSKPLSKKQSGPGRKGGRFEIKMLWIPNGPVTLVAGLIIKLLRAFVFLNCVAAVHHQGFTCYVGRFTGSQENYG